ncbi:AAA family ATPase [Photobacterium phosphoreum]|uniref:AAA family ATPase n=1 Tax=Photobacterium phosphoreum TaxID=659 RepID=UPI0024B728F8|nr:AAA family ATPase [Photobacterium phosphoreum]
MLIYFSAENFRSIKNEVVLDMRTAPRLRRLPHHTAKPLEKKEPKLSVLRSALIYGTNASGKSNIVKAISFVKDCVLLKNSAINGVKSEPFKLIEEINTESKFYIEFVSLGNHIGFGFSLDKERVLNEYLYLITDDAEYCIYERTFDSESQSYVIRTDVENSDDDDDDDDAKDLISQMSDFLLLSKYTAKNRLLLSEAIEKDLANSMPRLKDLLLPPVYFFKGKLQVIFPGSSYGGIHRDIIDKEDGCSDYAQLLNRFDTGVTGICSQNVDINSLPELVIQQVEEKLKINKSYPATYKGIRYNFNLNEKSEIIASKIITNRTINNSKIIPFELSEESDGTCRLLDLLPVITAKEIENEHTGRVYVIDEFNRSLHPSISKDFLSIFLNGKMSHPQDQLIVTTHESHLLDSELLRRDEIWFIQKEDDQSSILYSLNDYSERFDKDIRKAYLTGSYGAIPMGEYKRD